MSNPTGLVLYEGTSKLNGADIVAIATLQSTNVKTGNLVQVWILSQNISPTNAVFTQQNGATCPCSLGGKLKFRYKNKNGILYKIPHITGRVCYVAHHQAPTNIWKAFRQNKYPPLDETTQHLLQNRKIRIGSMGDPSAVPMKIWHKLLKISGQKWTSYTANWQNGHNNYLQRICQASVYTIEQAKIANRMGWFTFRISQDGVPRKNEIVCPASTGKTQCCNCMLCCGQYTNVVIKIHGSQAKVSAFSKLLQQTEN